MSEIEDIGLDEIYTELVSIEGKRGVVYLCGSLPADAALAAEIGAVLDGQASE